MRHRLATILILCIASFVLCLLPVRAAETSTRTDEQGSSFVTLFNGKDLAGWHGQETADPRKFTALSSDEKAKQLARDAAYWQRLSDVMVRVLAMSAEENI